MLNSNRDRSRTPQARALTQSRRALRAAKYAPTTIRPMLTWTDVRPTAAGVTR